MNSCLCPKEKFFELKEEFKSILSYNEKLKFWKRNELNGLVLFCIDSKEEQNEEKYLKELLIVYKKYKVKNYIGQTKTNDEQEYIDIYPANEKDLQELYSDLEPVIQLSNSIVGDRYITEYWNIVTQSPIPHEYLYDEKNRVDKLINRYNKQQLNSLILNDDVKKTAESILYWGYKHTVRGQLNIDFKELYTDVLADFNKITKTILHKPELIFTSYLAGKALAKYKGFLWEQSKRFEKGDDIRYKDDINITKSHKKTSVKLQWNSSNRALYDLFAQLMTITNGKSEPIVTNTIGSLALFLHENVEGLPDVSVIKRELEKMRSNDSIDLPKKNRIQLIISTLIKS